MYGIDFDEILRRIVVNVEKENNVNSSSDFSSNNPNSENINK